MKASKRTLNLLRKDEAMYGISYCRIIKGNRVTRLDPKTIRVSQPKDNTVYPKPKI